VYGAGLLLCYLLSQAAVPAEELQRGRYAFDRGEFNRAVEIVRPLLYPEIRLQSEKQIIQAHRILGVSYLFEREQTEATAEFRKLLQLSPDYHFDPLLDPPEVVDFFNTVRKDYSNELAQLEAKRKELESARRRDQEVCENLRAGPTVIEKRVGRNVFAANFIPFGTGQFQNGQRGKGWAFLSVEAALGAVSVGAFATNLALYGLRPQRSCRYDVGDAVCPADDVDHRDENQSRWLTRVQVASGALFFAGVLWGIADAIYYYRPETELGTTSAKVHQPGTASVRLSPLVMDRAIGPGLHFRF
jgi:tetratricopeptide (TPR) repeat protein